MSLVRLVSAGSNQNEIGRNLATARGSSFQPGQSESVLSFLSVAVHHSAQLRSETLHGRLQQAVFQCWRQSQRVRVNTHSNGNNFLIVPLKSLGFLTWFYFRLFQLDWMLSPCCASCYFCYYSKFLEDDEKLVAWRMSRDCRCEQNDQDMDMDETSASASHGLDQRQQD